jgi:hypothetical protein
MSAVPDFIAARVFDAQEATVAVIKRENTI